MNIEELKKGQSLLRKPAISTGNITCNYIKENKERCKLYPGKPYPKKYPELRYRYCRHHLKHHKDKEEKRIDNEVKKLEKKKSIEKIDTTTVKGKKKMFEKLKKSSSSSSKGAKWTVAPKGGKYDALFNLEGHYE